MEVEKLKEYYNQVDKCSITIKKEVDIDYVITQISKMAIYVEELNQVLGQLLVEQTRLDHIYTDKKFEHELRLIEYLTNNSDVKSLSTSKERRDYVNYFLMKEDYRDLVNIEQELKDIEKLIDLTKKKSRDLDKAYPKLKVIWEAVQSELKNLRKIGSDDEFIAKVRDSISDDQKDVKPIFSDTLVEEITKDSYHNKDKADTNLRIEDIIVECDTSIAVSRSESAVDSNLPEGLDILSDLSIQAEVDQLLDDL